MKIKRLAAIALAGTMVFSMAACSDNKDKHSSEETTNSSKITSVDEENANKADGVDKADKEEETKQEPNVDKEDTSVKEDEEKQEETKEEETSKDKGTARGDASVEDIVNGFIEYLDSDGKNYTYDSYMYTKMESEGVVIDMQVDMFTKSYDNITYTKMVTKFDMMGLNEEFAEESYVINKEDGTQVVATKEVAEDEWQVGVSTSIEFDLYNMLKEQKLELNELTKFAKVEKNGTESRVIFTIETGEVSHELYGELNSVKIDVVITYDENEGAIKAIAIECDIDSFNELLAKLGDVSYEKMEMKIYNIEKTTKPIDVPAEIEAN